jgi:hypothetical protein
VHGGSKAGISRVMHIDRACSARCCMSGLRSCAGDCVFG